MPRKKIVLLWPVPYVKNCGIFLNLGGGAARGFAHIGVLRAVEEERIPFERIVGVSMGAFVGSIYVIVPDVAFVRERLMKWLHSPEVQNSLVISYNKSINESTRSILRKIDEFYTKTGALGRILLSPGMVVEEEVHAAFHPFIAPIDIRKTRIPFACTAVSLQQGVARVFDRGSLQKAVLASSAMPLVFPPVNIDDEDYCDGGVLDKTGVEAATKLGARRTLVVDVSNEGLPQKEVRSGLDVFFRTEEIASYYRRQRQMRQASIVIQPIKGNIHWADYTSSDACIEMGYESIKNNIENIRAALHLVNPFKRYFLAARRLFSKKPKENRVL